MTITDLPTTATPASDRIGEDLAALQARAHRAIHELADINARLRDLEDQVRRHCGPR